MIATVVGVLVMLLLVAFANRAAPINTHKITIALAELGLDYQKIRVDRSRDKHMKDSFLKLSPNHKFPVLKDEERGITVWESGAILIYLCDQYDKLGQLLPLEGAARYTVLQSVFSGRKCRPTLGRLNSQMEAEEDKKFRVCWRYFMKRPSG